MASRILIVHDQPDGKESLRSAVESVGCVIVGTVQDAAEALTIARRDRPDIVLVHMDRADAAGCQVIRELRLDHHLPVVSIGTSSDEEMLVKACSSGCIAYLQEPLRAHELQAAIQIALHQDLTTFKAFAGHSWMRAMFDSLSDGVIATSTAGIVLLLNPAAQVLTGWMPFDAIGRPIDEVYKLSDLDTTRPVVQSQIHKILASQQATGKQRFLLTTRTGGRIPIEDSATSIVDGGELAGAVTIFTSIAARIAFEEAASAQQERLTLQVQTSQEALTRTQDEVASLAGRLLSAQEDERRRIARELHDDLAQRAALACQQVERLAKTFTGGSISPDVELLKSTIRGLADELRGAAHRLHPSILEDLGLIPALQSLVENFRALGLDLAAAIHQLPTDISLQTATALYRISQEALYNTLRHAPGAPARLSLKPNGSSIELRIEDAGPGFSTAQRRSGLGLSSMKEWARLTGGSFHLQSSPGEGTIIAVTAPLPA